jgi:hypothetical protein
MGGWEMPTKRKLKPYIKPLDEAYNFQDRLKWYRWRWEFMRRNPNYRATPEIDPYHRLNPDIDPGKSFEELMAAGYKFRMPVEGPALNEEVVDWGKLILKIEIHFNEVNSITGLKKHINELIDNIWLLHVSRPGHETMKMTDYKRIITVGELREKGTTFEEIGRLVFPNLVNSPKKDCDDIDTGKTRAQQDYKKYEKLINGGWKKIHYP